MFLWFVILVVLLVVLRLDTCVDLGLVIVFCSLLVLFAGLLAYGFWFYCLMITWLGLVCLVIVFISNSVALLDIAVVWVLMFTFLFLEFLMLLTLVACCLLWLFALFC